MKHSIFLSLLTISALLFASCEKDSQSTNEPIIPSSAHSAWILNEGGFGGNDADISFLDLDNGTIINDVFAEQNGRGLGDVAQDIIQYGSKLYISVWNSNTIEVVDAKTGKSIKQIDMGQRGPRHLLGLEGKVYVTCYSKSIVRIDTVSLSLDAQECPLSGMQPENLCRIGNKIYVSNSWEYQGSNIVYDNTLSVIDIATFREEKKITVGTNPSNIAPINDHQILICCQNDALENSLMILDLNNETTLSLDILATNFDIYQNTCYSYYQNWFTGESTLQKTDLSTMESTPIDISSVGLTSPYGIKVNPTNGYILITDAGDYTSNGDVAFISSEGRLLWKSETSIGPSKILLMN